MDSDDFPIIAYIFSLEIEHPPFDMSNEPACVAKDAEIFSEYNNFGATEGTTVNLMEASITNTKMSTT